MSGANNTSGSSVGTISTVDQAGAERPQLTFGRAVSYLLVGVFFGIVLVKGEIISWFRIQEMFHFQSIHMYGVIGLAVVTGLISILILRAAGARSLDGISINPKGKPFNKIGNPVGGVIFGFGWALTGACPGPLYATLGAGYWPIALAIGAALLGVLTYGVLKPHRKID